MERELLVARTPEIEPGDHQVSRVDLADLFGRSLDGWTVVSHSMGPFGRDGRAYVSIVVERPVVTAT